MVEAVTPPELPPIVAVPVPLVVAKPATLGAFAMVATPAEDELQWVVSVMSCVVPSLNDPVAVNCCWLPAAMVQESPLRLVDVLPSLNVPVAVNLTEVPFAILGLLGLMVMETRCAVETVKLVEPLTEPQVAVIVLVPVATLVTKPWLLMVTVAGVEELHRAEAVTFCVLLSLKVPVAVNCLFVPTGMFELAGVTAIETRVALLEVRDAVPVTEPEVALMVVVPVPTAVARPEELTVEALGADDDHVTEVNNWVLPSSKLPTAVNCWVVPTAIEAVAGLIEIEIKLAGTTVRAVESVRAPTVAVTVVVPAPTVVARPELLMLATDVDEELQVTPLTRS